MKKLIAVLLCLAMIFTFAACKKNPDTSDESETTTEETTGRPGDWVTNADGEVQTVVDSYIMLDENSKPMTEIVTDEQGSEKQQLVTTVIYDIETYPGAETVPTVAPGNTNPANVQAWPSYSFMSKLPKLADNVDDVSYSKNDEGEIAIIYFNDVSYEEYLAYVEKCKKAGFEQSYGHNLPEEEEAGASYIYYSIANGLYVGISYDTDTAPYRYCDVKISISSYDVSGAMS